MVDIVALTDSLLDASINGVNFLYLDSRDEPGRRVLRFLFPGSDIPAFQDLGADAGPIAVTGVIISDDNVYMANKLRAVFAQPGPYTFVHPWLGTVSVVLEKRPVFTDAQDKLRLTSFQASFWLYTPIQPQPPSTLDELLDAMDDLRTAARAGLAQILAPAAMALSALSAVGSFAAQAVGWFTIATGGGLQSIVAESLAGVAGINTLLAGSPYPAAVGSALAAPSAALLAATTPPVPAAVGPGGATTPQTPIDGRITAGAMLSVAGAAAAANFPVTPGPELALALQALLLADTCAAASDIVYTDATEAQTWRDRIAAALDAAARQAAAAASAATAPASPVALGGVWAALLAARGAWMADMSAVIGRLPVVRTLALPRVPVSVWLVGQYLSGDNPANLVATVQTLAARNVLYCPGGIGTPTLEVLVPA